MIELMFGLNKVMTIDLYTGEAFIVNYDLIPYGLYIDNDDKINNILNFYYWLSNRMLSLDRKFSKEILNSLGLKQAITDKDRATIVMKYHSVNLQDRYWTKFDNEEIVWDSINLYDNSLSESMFDISLRGINYTIANSLNANVSQDINLNGKYPKAWKRSDKGLFLYKGDLNNEDSVRKEVMASKLLKILNISCVDYHIENIDNKEYSVCKNFITKGTSFVSASDLEVWCNNNDLNLTDYVRQIDAEGYSNMNVADYLLGNTDRHKGNWGILVDDNNKPVKFCPLFDFNNCFNTKELTGIGCLPEENKITQCKAALSGLSSSTVNLEVNVEDSMFPAQDDYSIFVRRLNILREYRNKMNLF